MDLDAILAAEPINGTARRVTSQRGAATEDTPLSREELVELVNRLQRKHRLLRRVLGIKNNSQHQNTLYKARHGIRQYRAAKEPRSLTEYVRCGQEMQRLIQELAELRKVRRFVAEAQREYKEATRGVGKEGNHAGDGA